MTWVIGASPPLGGYGLLVSDVRVRLSDSRELDIIRKVHFVGPSLVLGFAGSVQLGFAMVDSLREHLALPPDAPWNAAWIPADVADSWQPKAAAIYACADPGEKRLGCHLLVVGVHPTEDIGMPRARVYVIRMVHPLFHPGYSQRRLVSVLSIGTGSQVVAYRRAIRELCRWESGLFQAEVGNTGGWGQAITFALTKTIEWHGEPGISPHLHWADVRRDSIGIYRNDRVDYPREGEPQEFSMPAVASSYVEYCQMVQQQSLASAGAQC